MHDQFHGGYLKQIGLYAADIDRGHLLRVPELTFLTLAHELKISKRCAITTSEIKSSNLKYN